MPDARHYPATQLAHIIDSERRDEVRDAIEQHDQHWAALMALTVARRLIDDRPDVDPEIHIRNLEACIRGLPTVTHWRK